MPTFTYKARDRSGRSQQGNRDAPSAAALANDLRGQGWLVLDVRASAKSSEPDVGRFTKLNPFYWLPPRSLDVELGFQQLAVMLRSGLTLLTALRTVAEQAARPSMRRIWRQVAERIQEGSSFAEALSQHSCFSHLTVQLVRVGEQTGILETVLVRAADLLERRRTLRTNMLTALAYPTIVVIAAVGVSLFLVFSVIPKLGRFLTTLGRRLPPMTQSLVDVSNFLRESIVLILIGIAVAIVAFIAVYLWPPGRYWIDRILLRIPIIGNVFRMAATTLFARAMGLLIRSGITLLDGLRTAESLQRNRFLVHQVSHARESVMRGGNLADALKMNGAFLPMLSHMVAVGESAGTLDDVLDEVATFYEQQLDRTIRRLSALIEPIIIIVVGSIVGYVYIAFFMALFAAAGSR